MVGVNLDPILVAEEGAKDRLAPLSAPRQEKYWNRNHIITGFLIFLSIGIYLYSECLKKREKKNDLMWLHSANTAPGSDAWPGSRMEKSMLPLALHPFLVWGSDFGFETAEGNRTKITCISWGFVKSSNSHLWICWLGIWSPALYPDEARDFPGGPVDKTPCSQCRGPSFIPWSGN